MLTSPATAENRLVRGFNSPAGVKDVQHMEQYPAAAAGTASSDSAVESRRYRQSLRRSWLLMLAIVLPLTGVVVAVSLVLPPTYRATATIVLSDEGVSTSGDAELVARELETLERIVKTRPVLAAAGRTLGTSADALSDKVSASASTQANLLRLSAEDDEAEGAAQIANTVAQTFLTHRVATTQRSLAATRQKLLARIDRLEGGGRPGEVAGLRDTLRSLAVQEASLGGSLVLAERARVPDEAASPRILQSTLFALFGFSFIAVLVALAREQVAPRAEDATELAELVGAPLLVEMPVPKTGARSARRPTDSGAFESIRDAIATLLPSTSSLQTVLVSSLHRDSATAEIGTTVARAFANEGERVVLLSSVVASSEPRTPPATEIVRRLEAGEDIEDLLARAEIAPGLIAFSLDSDVALATRADLAALGAALAERGVRRLLVVGPPLLVSRNGLLLASLVDGVVLVCRPERTTRAGASRIRRLLRASGANVLGIVSVGARQVVPYRLSAPLLERPSDSGRLEVAAPLQAHAAGPDEGGDEPEMAPVQRVDEEAVREQAAPGGEQGGRADSVRVARGQSVPSRKPQRRQKQREQG
jgi:Mrp family chromosome partitioning ATPase